MKITLVICLSMCLVGVFAVPEPEAVAEPQYHRKEYSAPYSHPPAYSKPAYPKPTYPEPAYPRQTYSKPAYPEPTYSKPTYHKEEPYKQSDYGKKYEYCDPRAAPKCVKNDTEIICLKDEEYPMREIEYAIQYDPLALKKYAEVAEQSADNLVDGLTSLSEKHFDYSLYNGKTFEKGNWVGGEGYICPSDVKYTRPVRAKNVDGEWRVIVQDVAYYTQTQRIETCLFPGASCRTLAPCHRSTCVQKYVYQRMLSFDPCDTQKGIFIDIYKLPSACSCNIPSKFN